MLSTHTVITGNIPEPRLFHLLRKKEERTLRLPAALGAAPADRGFSLLLPKASATWQLPAARRNVGSDGCVPSRRGASEKEGDKCSHRL